MPSLPASPASSPVALLLIDPQLAFTEGAWACHFGDVAPIRRAFAELRTLLTSGVLERCSVSLLTTRVPYSAPDCDVEPSLAPFLDAAPFVVKPNTDVTASDGFPEWLAARRGERLRRLVVGGCTTTSCVRVSSQRIKRAHPDLDVVVDLSLCGARDANHEKTAAADAELVAIYGPELCHGRSAVDLAIHQMREAGVEVVERYHWVDVGSSVVQ